MSDGRPQDPRLNRSGTTPLTPDSIEGELEARDQPTDCSGEAGPVPESNRPGTGSGDVQDKPTTPPDAAASSADGPA